ncbi:phage tail assembly protein [Acinetobacter sp. Ac_5812]|uniref:phage tail assembly protein n=1 Tax=Acinetobacter sp. Ac_5812 TaxID=1848937 RepID=UPI00149022C2|nr:phage tail assembly protein [Acinetobacter sp. Ac_5812]NNP68963.1 hypothetical protein [Acinetobacter sp. Ac_5812]
MQNQEIPENEVVEYPTPYDYTLVAPVVDAGGISVTSINLQEPTIAEIESLSDNTKKFGSMKAFKTMLANHTKVDVATINKMGARDLNGIQKYYDYFLGV